MTPTEQADRSEADAGHNSKKHLVRNVLSLGGVQIANYILPLISIPVIVRIIGPDKFGVINYAMAFVVYFNLLVAYGFDLTATRRIARDPSNTVLRNKVFSEVIYAKMLLFVIAVIAFIICLFTVPLLAAEKKVAIFTFFLCGYTAIMQNWFFQAMQQLQKIAVFNLISRLAFTITVLLFIKNRSDYVLQPLLAGLAQLAVAAASMAWAVRHYNLKIVRVPFFSILSMLWQERIVFFSTVVISLYTTTNTVVLGFFQTSAQVGFYTGGQKLVDIINSIINIPLSQALFPFIGVAFGQGVQKGIETVRKIVPLVVVITLFTGICILVLGPAVVVWFYGKQFAPSVKVFQVLSCIPLLVALSNLFGIQVMLNLKMDKAFFKVTAIGAVTGLIFNVVMIHYAGYVGTAWNWVLVELFITAALYFVLRKNKIDPIDINDFALSRLKLQVTSLFKTNR